MIVKAAVKIYDFKLNKEIIIPCMRHCDAFHILKEFGYSKKDYKEIEQGFLDEHNNFYNRTAAYQEALHCKQLKEINDNYKTLYSEDIW